MLTVRERLRGGGDDLIKEARAAGQAIFSMKSGSPPSVIKAIRALAGIDPSPLSLRDASAAVSVSPSLGPFMHVHYFSLFELAFSNDRVSLCNAAFTRSLIC